MEVKYVTIPVKRIRQEEERCYNSVACGLVLVAVGVLVWAALLAILWSETLQALGEESVSESQCLISENSVFFGETPTEYTDTQTDLPIDTQTVFDLGISESTVRFNPSPLTESEWIALAESCTENSIPVEVGLGLIWTESRFDPSAVSQSGCYGYCQLNPRYFPSGLSPEDNIRYGMNYLGSCLARYGTMDAALTAYNAGYDTGSRVYANTVLSAAQKWKEQL